MNNKKIKPLEILNKGLSVITGDLTMKGNLIDAIKEIEAYLLLPITYDTAIPVHAQYKLEEMICEFDVYYWAYEYNNQTKKQGLVNLAERLQLRLYELQKKITEDESKRQST